MSEEFYQQALLKLPQVRESSEIEEIVIHVFRFGGMGSSVLGIGTATSATAGATLSFSVTGALISAFMMIYGVNNAGNRSLDLAQHNAFLTGFCRSVASFAFGHDLRRHNAAAREYSIAGRLTAIEALRTMRDEDRNNFFASLRRLGQEGAFREVLRRMGGYRIR